MAFTHATMCGASQGGGGCYAPWCSCSCHQRTYPAEWTVEQKARYDEIRRWEARLEDLTTPLTGDEWERLAAQLREDARPHRRDEQLYLAEAQCPHHALGSPVHVRGLEDDLHVWGGEDGDVMICLGSPTGDLVCMCEGYYCGHRAHLEAEREDLWWRVSLNHEKGGQDA